MKNNSFFWVLAFALTLFGTTSCTKENTPPDATLISEHTRQILQQNLIGSWQLAEKGVEVAMHDGHICPDPANMAAGTVTYIVNWGKVSAEDTQVFKSDGSYRQGLTPTLTCSGRYTISNHAVLEIISDCKSSSARIEELTPTGLIVKDGALHLKYHRLN